MKQQASKSCIPKGIEGSNPSLSEKIYPPLRRVNFFGWSNANCLALRRDLKPGAMFLFEARSAERQKPRGQALEHFSSEK